MTTPTKTQNPLKHAILKFLANPKGQIVVAGAILLALISLVAYLLIGSRLDPAEQYENRIKLADESLEIVQTVSEQVSPDGVDNIQFQVSEQDYNAYLGIETPQNREKVQALYGQAVDMGKMVDENLAEHKATVAQAGGIVTPADLAKLDTLPITDPEVRNTILENIGVNELEFQKLRTEQGVSEVRKPLAVDGMVNFNNRTTTHSHDHHDHSHDHNHSHSHERHDHDH